MTFKPGTTIYDKPPRPFVECAFIGCTYEALVRSKNMNLCRVHYEQQGNKEAQEHAERNGLKTAADHRAWMENPKSAIAKRYADEVRQAQAPKPVRERIPGEDDDLETPALGIPIDDLERQFADAAQP